MFDAARSFLASVLAGSAPAWPTDPGWEDAFWKWGAYHGVLPLVAEAARSGRGAGWPAAVRSRLVDLARREAAVELARKRELLAVLKALKDPGARPLVIKGSALAYWLYPEPQLRVREDTDLLVAPGTRAAVTEALAGMGYDLPNQVAGEIVGAQAGFRKTDDAGVRHHLDIHWRSSNSPLLSGVLEHGTALTEAMEIPALGPGVLGQRPVEALLFACAHRAGHLRYRFDGHRHGDCLIWLYDLHLLAQRLSRAEWGRFSELAGRHRVRAICRDGLLAARSAFGTPLDRESLERLDVAGEPSSVLLEGAALAVKLRELAVLPTWGAKLRFLRELVLPDPGYLLRKYGRRSRWWLPWLYLRRAVAGLTSPGG